MPAHALTCPGCGKVLRTTAAPPAGARITCPACGRGFVPAEARSPADPPPGRSRPRGLFLIVALLALLLTGLILLGAGVIRLDLWKPADRPDRTDLLAFVPPDANLLMGADLAALRERGQVDAVLAALKAQAVSRSQRDLAPEVEQMLRMADTALLATAAGSKTNAVLVVQGELAVVDLFLATVQRGDARLGPADVPVYPFTANRGAATGWVAAPGAQLLLLALEPEPLMAALTAGTQPDRPRNPALDFKPAVDGGHGWAVLLFDADLRKRLADNPEVQAKVAAVNVLFAGALPALKRANAATLQLEAAEPAAVNVRLNLHCADPTDAASVRAGFEKAWKNPLNSFLLPAVLPKTLSADLQRSLAFDHRAATATARAQLSPAALRELQPGTP